MIGKDRLLKIRDLQLSGKIDRMDSEQLDKYCKDLDAFVESYPDKEARLKKSFEAEDYDSFCETLLDVWYELSKIHAKGLAKNCRNLLGEAGISRPAIVESHLTCLLTAISALSIDIQMAQYRDAAPNEAGEESAPAVADEACREGDGHKIILAVDDVRLLIKSLRSVLQNTSYKIIGVKSGADALMFIKSNNPDLFILDIDMPEMNGYELAGKIREDGHTAPIVFLTGNSSREHVVKAIQAGAADFIVKPINKEQVVDKINRLIG